MLKKSTKIWGFLLLILVLVVLIAGKSKENIVTDCGLAEATTWEELTKLNILIKDASNVIIGEEREIETYQMLVEHEDDFLDLLSEVPMIAIVSPLDQLEYNSDTIGQKVLIENVLQGDQKKNGTIGMVYQYGAFGIENGKPICKQGNTFMNPKEKYLLFLKPSTLNEIWEKEVYYIDPIWFPFLSLNKEIPLLEKKEYYNFNEINGIGVPSNSKQIVEQMNKIRRKILEYYSL